MEETRPPDFTGWATKSNMRCSDGRTIKPGAFAHMDKKKVPLVWMHQHKEPDNVLGHAILEDRAFGTYAEAWFNGTPKAQHMKLAVEHGDVDSLSIYANNLQEQKIVGGKEVYHGDIKELSLVVAGANPGALIDHVNIIHADGAFEELDDQAIITTGLFLNHTEEGEPVVADTDTAAEVVHADATTDVETDAETDLDEDYVKKVFGEMTKEQQTVSLYLAGAAFEAGEEAAKPAEDAPAADAPADAVAHSDIDSAPVEPSKTADEGLLAHMDTTTTPKGNDMNVFDRTDEVTPKSGTTLSHAKQADVIAKAKKVGSFRDLVGDGTEEHPGVLEHADYGVEDIELLFPDARLDGGPSLIARRTEWVQAVLSGVKKQPFAKIKSLTFDITAPEARARGYIKGTEKKDEVVKLLKRTTGPTTVYKKQKLDRDDILDITDFDIVVWLKWEIRFMLDEEIARAILIGDGRLSSNPDKIKDPEGAVDGVGIRSILLDHEMYSHKIEVAANTSVEDRIEAITRARSVYRGSGNPTFFTTDSEITEMLLLKDKVGRRLYGTEAELASVLRVSGIVAVEVMEEVDNLLGIVVNLKDYTVGANRGGELTFFSDFDIDFNQEKYLMETRISGALNKPKSAVVLTRDEGTAVNAITAPSFNGATNTITIPTTVGVVYEIDDEPVTGNVVIEEDTQVVATGANGYYIPSGVTKVWSYTYTD